MLLAVGCGEDPASGPEPADAGVGGSSGAGGSGGSGGGSGSSGSAGAAPGAPLAEATLAATHNSYSGGERGSILAQLDLGVRFVEFDVHDNDFATSGYRIGHDAAGDEVELGGDNPNELGLGAWLAVVDTWSVAHPTHAPIVVALDLKDSLEDNPSAADGNPGALNELLTQSFGSRLFPASDAGAGIGGIDALRGRILGVLSGHEGTRIAYRRDRGQNAAVAVNAQGSVVEVHDSGDGALWYWTGTLSGSSITWRRHARYDTGQNPAVALDDGGSVVEVHEDPDSLDDQLWYRVGKLTAEGDIAWATSSGQPFPNADEGVSPSVRFVGANSVREIHESASTGEHWYWNGALDAAALTITWTRDSGDGGQTSDPLWDAAKDGTVQVLAGADGGFGSDTLLARVGSGAPERIRYQQLLFVESQHGGAAALEGDGLWFFAASATNAAGRSWAAERRAAGKLTRLWGFSMLTPPGTPPSLPATDFPMSAWYADYCDAEGCLEL